MVSGRAFHAPKQRKTMCYSGRSSPSLLCCLRGMCLLPHLRTTFRAFNTVASVAFTGESSVCAKGWLLNGEAAVRKEEGGGSPPVEISVLCLLSGSTGHCCAAYKTLISGLDFRTGDLLCACNHLFGHVISGVEGCCRSLENLCRRADRTRRACC